MSVHQRIAGERHAAPSALAPRTRRAALLRLLRVQGRWLFCCLCWDRHPVSAPKGSGRRSTCRRACRAAPAGGARSARPLAAAANLRCWALRAVYDAAGNWRPRPPPTRWLSLAATRHGRGAAQLPGARRTCAARVMCAGSGSFAPGPACSACACSARRAAQRLAVFSPLSSGLGTTSAAQRGSSAHELHQLHRSSPHCATEPGGPPAPRLQRWRSGFSDGCSPAASQRRSCRTRPACRRQRPRSPKRVWTSREVQSCRTALHLHAGLLAERRPVGVPPGQRPQVQRAPQHLPLRLQRRPSRRRLVRAPGWQRQPACVAGRWSQVQPWPPAPHA